MTITCVVCKKDHLVPITPEQIALWTAGKHIQDAAPNLTSGQRELLISGMCCACFDAAFHDCDE